MNIYNICDNRFALIFQWNADECSMHLLHLHTCCVCSRPEIVTFNKLRIHVPPHPWQGCYVRLESISKAYLLITDALPSRKTKIDWMIEHVLLECLCCHLWKYDLSAMNWRWHPWIGTSWLKLKFWKGYVGLWLHGWSACTVYIVYWGWKLDMLCKNNIQPARQSLDITVPRSGEDENHLEIWGQNRMSETVTLRSLWMNEYKSKNLDTDSPDRRPRQRTCCNVLVYCIVFLLNRARLLTVEIPREHPKLLFHVWRCSHVVGYCSNKDLHMTLRLTLPQKYVNGANKEALKSRMGREGSRSVLVKRQYTAFWHTQFWSLGG